MIKYTWYHSVKRKIVQYDLIKIGFISLILLFIPIFLWHIPFIKHLLTQVSLWQNSSYAMVIFLACGVPYSAVGLPKQPLCLAAGLAFGFWKGIFLMALICEIGAIISYFLGKYCFSKHVTFLEKKGSFFQKIANFIYYSPFSAILMLRLMPVGSAFLISVVSGVIKVPLWAFIWGSLFGSLPQEVVFVLVGSSGVADQQFNIIFAVILFVISAIFGLYLVKNYQAQS